MKIEVISRFTISNNKPIWRIKFPESNIDFVGKTIKSGNDIIGVIKGYTLLTESKDFSDQLTYNKQNGIFWKKC